MAGPAAAALASETDLNGLAESAGDSTGINVAVALLGVGALYLVFTMTQEVTDVSQGGQEAADGVGDATGSTFDGTQDFIEDSSNWWLGGGADLAEGAWDFGVGGPADVIDGTGDVAEDVVDGAGDLLG